MVKINKVLIIIFLFLVSLISVEIYYYLSLYKKPAVISNLKTSSAKFINELSSGYEITKLSDTIVSVKSKGKIIYIENKNKLHPKTKIAYDFMITIRDNGKNNNFFYSIEDAKKLTVSEGGRIISLNNLKVGDSIYIKETLDLTKELKDSLVKSEVIKY